MDLFEHLPEKIFRPLGGRSARFNASLLLHLHERIFSTAGETPPRHAVLSEIADYIDRYEGPDLGDVDDIEVDPALERAFRREAKGQAVGHYYRFYDLVQSGWLVELRDRYRKLIDLSPGGRLLLREFKLIASGDRRAYGGEVLQVLAQLRLAIEDPDNKSASIGGASSFAESFAHHLRSMAASMRLFEQKILAERELPKVFKSFFEEFVSQHLVTDYKTLHTKHNPFRFRTEVIDKTHFIMNDSLLLSRLAQGYVREGRAATEEQAEDIILREVDEVYRTFDTIDAHLGLIKETQFRIERKIHTIIRYMDRFESGSIERVSRAMEALGATSLDMKDPVEGLEPAILLWTPPIGWDSLTVKSPPKPPVDRTRYRPVEKDPALEAYFQDKKIYQERISLSPTQIEDFIHRSLEGRDIIRGSEVSIASVDDFIVFQRLREVPYMFNGQLSEKYGLRMLDEQAENQWIVFTDFEIYRKSKVVDA